LIQEVRIIDLLCKNVSAKPVINYPLNWL